jgi:hypothetical protein
VMEPYALAIADPKARMNRWRHFHFRLQFRGSFGSSDGCGESTMPPFLLEASSSGILSSLVSLIPNLEVPRGNADRLLSSTPQPMMRGFGVQMELMRKGRPASVNDRMRKVANRREKIRPAVYQYQQAKKRNEVQVERGEKKSREPVCRANTHRTPP